MPDTSLPDGLAIPSTAAAHIQRAAEKRFLNLSRHKSTAVFIDAANLASSLRSIELHPDYLLLRDLLAREVDLLRIYYYYARMPDGVDDSMVKLTDWLAHNGYCLVCKPGKEQYDSSGRRTLKGNMDIELAVDMLEMAGAVQQMVLFSGDGDFRRVVEAVQRKGVRVAVVSTRKGNTPSVADELVRQADQFIDLVEIAGEIRRDTYARRQVASGFMTSRQSVNGSYGSACSPSPQSPFSRNSEVTYE